MKRRCHLDFETRSTVDITKVGGASYSMHPTTEILCICFAVNEGPVRLIDRGVIESEYREDTDQWAELRELAFDPETIFVAHNAAFEQDVWLNILVPYFRMPVIAIERWECTMAKAYAHGLPGSLENAAKALKLAEQKDMSGKATMMKLSKPRKLTKSNDNPWWEPDDVPALFETLYEYCRQDVVVEHALDKRLRGLSKKEQELWYIDQRMNRDGIRVEMSLVETAIRFIEIQKTRDLDDFAEATDGALYSPGQTKALLSYLQAKGLSIRNLKAETIESVLAMSDLSDELRRVLELRSSATKTSLAKYYRILETASGGRLRRLLQYHGARPGRWTARDVQLHNLMRPLLDASAAISVLALNNFDLFDIIYPVNGALASCVRGMFVPDTGFEFLIGDYSQIESKSLAWLAGAEEKLRTFRAGKDIYCFNATGIYNKEVTPDMKKERSTGKVAELALGYEGGIGALVTMAAQARVDLRTLVPVFLSSATTEEMDYANFDYLMYCKRTEYPVAKPIGIVCSIIKKRWRDANSYIVQLWHDMLTSACEAVLRKKPVKCGKVTWFLDDIWLYCKLPSGRMMAYPYPKCSIVGRKKNGAPNYELSYAGPFGREGLYGGKIVENVNQATARDLMADAMHRLEKVYPVVFTVHDELISQAPLGQGDLKLFESMMLELEPCYEGLPLTAKVHKAERYGKDD